MMFYALATLCELNKSKLHVDNLMGLPILAQQEKETEVLAPEKSFKSELLWL